LFKNEEIKRMNSLGTMHKQENAKMSICSSFNPTIYFSMMPWDDISNRSIRIQEVLKRKLIQGIRWGIKPCIQIRSVIYSNPLKPISVKAQKTTC
jgi:hypothetical protein